MRNAMQRAASASTPKRRCPAWRRTKTPDRQPTEKLNDLGDASGLARTSQPLEQAPVYGFLAQPESSVVVSKVV